MNGPAISVPVAAAAKPVKDSGRAFFWRLIWIYLLASAVAVGVTIFLATLGLEFTLVQWLTFWGSVPFGVAVYLTADVWMIRRHLKPLTPVLTALDRGERVDDARLGAAIVRALNMPQYSSVRVMALHGPLATIMLTLLTYGLRRRWCGTRRRR